MKELESCLKKVFFCEYAPTSLITLKHIWSLISYYGDDVPPDLISEINLLRSVILKIELAEKMIKDPQSVPTHFSCDIHDSCTRQPVQNFTFSPVINMPEYPEQTIDWDMINMAKDEVANMDLFSIVAYIKKKAIAAKDLPIVDNNS